MRHAQHWGVSLLAGVIVSAVAIPSLAQDKDSEPSHEESPTLEAAVELAETGELTDVEINQLAQQLASRADLSVTDQPAHVQAEFDLDDSQAVVSGKTVSDGRVELLVQIGGISIDAIYDPAESTFHIDGHGGSLRLEDSIILQAFSFRLEKEHWDPDWRGSPLVKRLARRLIALVSMAPVNYRFDAQTIEVPVPPGKESALDSPPAASSQIQGPSQEERRGLFSASFSGECLNEVDGACAYPGTDFIGLACKPPANITLPHTACPEHEWCFRQELVGRNVNNCLGRCGISCGSDGYGKYYLDCAAHDSCCRVHGGCSNPGHALCGDEFNAATPETLFGAKNCKPPLCPVVAATNTWTVAPRVGVTPALEQLQFGLERYEWRPETTVYLEEWAILAVERDVAGVRVASTDAFGEHVARSAAALASSDRTGTSVLIVEAAEHPYNARHIPTPTVEPFEVELAQQGAMAAQDFWFRVEVSASGEVDRVTFLESSRLHSPASAEEAIRANLHLQYVDEQRHRCVVFGLGSIDNLGRLVVSSGLVIVPMCCPCHGPGCPPPEY